MNLSGKKVLITGGSGFLGKRLIARFREAGSEVFAPRRSECDLTRREDLERVLAATKPDIVIHCFYSGPWFFMGRGAQHEVCGGPSKPERGYRRE